MTAMMGWKDTTLGEVITLQRGFDLPAQDRQPGSVPIVSSSGVSGRHSEPKVKAPGVVTGRYGTIGEVFFITEDFWPLNTTLWVKDFKGNDPRFISYLLKTISFFAHSDKSSVPGVNRNHLHMERVSIPEDVQEQRAIASVLNALDNKIDLNRRMNESLDAVAQGLFRSWFVDFDPVQSRSVGEEPWGMDTATAARFPDAFDGSELGEIPRGWRVERLSELVSTQYGYTASAVREPLGPKFLRVMDINKQNWIDWSRVPHCVLPEGESDAYRLHVGDIVVARMADPGKSAIIESDEEAVFASYLVRLKAPTLEQAYFIYGCLKSPLYNEYAQAVTSGSVQKNMNAKVIVGAHLVVPPAPLMEEYVGRILPLRHRINSNLRENVTLAELRDALLPKLLSGQVRVEPEAKVK